MTIDKPIPLPHAKHAPHVVTVTDLDSEDELLEVPSTIAPENTKENMENIEPPREAPTAGETIEIEAGAAPSMGGEKKKKKKKKSKNVSGYEEAI